MSNAKRTEVVPECTIECYWAIGCTNSKCCIPEVLSARPTLGSIRNIISVISLIKSIRNEISTSQASKNVKHVYAGPQSASLSLSLSQCRIDQAHAEKGGTTGQADK